MEELNEKNQLSDIVLNKTSTSNSNKKILLAVATLGIVLIVVVVLMNTLNSNGTQNLPQATLPPKPQVTQQPTIEDEPLFEEVQVLEDGVADDDSADLDQIAQRLKQQSQQTQHVQEQRTQPKTAPAPQPKQHVQHAKVAPKTTHHKVTHPVQKHTVGGHYYIQVGSFAKYEPNKKFLHKITSLGYHYKYHKVGKLNKVLVGPFATPSQAAKAKKQLRAHVTPGAFLVKL